MRLVPGRRPGKIDPNLEYFLGSERAKRPPGLSGVARAPYVPSGLCHAIALGTRRAACGATRLVVWNRRWGAELVVWNQHWGGRQSLELCRRCLKLVPPA